MYASKRQGRNRVTAWPIAELEKGIAVQSGGFMDILAALRQEEAKWEKEMSAAQQQLDNVRAAIKLLGGVGSIGGKATASSSGKKNVGKKRVLSAASRARISKATKERWAKFRAAKAKQ